jgi:hypothetical protein
MAPPRKPKIGLDRPKAKSAEKPREQPKEKQKEKYPNSLPSKLNNNQQKEQPKTKTPHEWKQVAPKHVTCSEEQQREIARIMPQLEEIIKTPTDSTGKKLPHWLTNKFRELKQHVEKTNRSELKVKETFMNMKNIARSLGHLELFANKFNEIIFKRPSKTTFDDELKQTQDEEFNQDDKEFDL